MRVILLIYNHNMSPIGRETFPFEQGEKEMTKEEKLEEINKKIVALEVKLRTMYFDQDNPGDSKHIQQDAANKKLIDKVEEIRFNVYNAKLNGKVLDNELLSEKGWLLRQIPQSVEDLELRKELAQLVAQMNGV